MEAADKTRLSAYFWQHLVACQALQLLRGTDREKREREEERGRRKERESESSGIAILL